MSRLPVNNSAYHDSAARAKQDAWAALGAIVAGREAHKLTDATHGVLAADVTADDQWWDGDHQNWQDGATAARTFDLWWPVITRAKP